MSCMFCEKGLDLDSAIRLLENIEQYPVINQPPIKPKGGEVYIYFPDTPNEQENYKCDQYRWLNSGPKEIPRKNPLVKKQYFIGKLPKGKTQAFQKHCYVLVTDQRNPYPVLLHYMGDETVMVDYPHGNAKKNNSRYFAIAPSVRKEIASKSQTALPTAIINSYKSNPSSYLVNENGDKDINPVLTPRNKSQVRNIRRKLKSCNEKNCLPVDDLKTLYSIGTEISGFCHYTRTQPEIVCCIGLNELSLEASNLIKLNNNSLVFSFQDSHKIGRYHVTPFCFIHNAFAGPPTIPTYFLISEQCSFLNFEMFLQTIRENIPALAEEQVAVITNQDYNFTASLGIVFPNWIQIYDWEVLFVAARAYLRKINMDIKDISLRIQQLKYLMSLDTIESYKIELKTIKDDWPLAFCEYYAQVLMDPIEQKLGKWVLEKFKLYIPQVGVLRAVNPALQLVIKQLQDIKDTSLDILLASFYHLQMYLHVNIQKGFCQQGVYTLNNAFTYLSRDLDEVALPRAVYEPSAIVKTFRVRGMTMFSETFDSADDESTVMLQAKRIVEMGDVSHSAELQGFLVKSTSGSLHGVQLFPRQTCSCSISQKCAHIIAVMLTLGMAVTSNKKNKPSKTETDSQLSDEKAPLGTQSHLSATEVTTPPDSDAEAAIEALRQISQSAEEKSVVSEDKEQNVDSQTLGDTLDVTQSEVLMVVTEANDDNKPLIAYELSQRNIVLYDQNIEPRTISSDSTTEEAASGQLIISLNESS